MENKNSKKIIVVIAGILLLLLLFFVVAGKKPTSNSNNQQANQMQPKNDAIANGNEDFKGNMMDLFKSGKNTKCTYSNKNDEYSIEGTTYIAGNKMRTDASTTMKDQNTIESHMISDGTWVYSWSSAMPQGIKMKIDTQLAQTNPDNKVTSQESYAKTFQENYDFKCSKWTTDQSKFELPLDVTFTDFSQMAKPAQDGQNNACAACNYIQDADAKAQCLKSLGCK